MDTVIQEVAEIKDTRIQFAKMGDIVEI